jgi:hypothetical protein
MKPLVVDSCNRDGIYAVRVAVKVTLVTVGCAVPTRINEDGAFSATPVGDPIHDGFFDKVTGGLHRLSVIRRSPATTKDRGFLEAKIERGSFINVGDGSREYSNPSYFGIPSDTNTTYIILNGPNLTCATSSVVIVKQFGGREVFVVIEIMRTLGPLPSLHISGEEGLDS